MDVDVVLCYLLDLEGLDLLECAELEDSYGAEVSKHFDDIIIQLLNISLSLQSKQS